MKFKVQDESEFPIRNKTENRTFYNQKDYDLFALQKFQLKHI